MTATPTVDPPADAPSPPLAMQRAMFWTGVGTLVLIWIAWAPIFLCMPLWVDTVQYDIHARNILIGGIPYEDSSDSNLPGIMWIQTALRAVIGWDSLPIRLFDLAVVALEFWLILGWMPVTASRTCKVWTLVGLSSCYLLSTELVHCQRDVWMMLIALVALGARRRQVEGRVTGWRAFVLSLGEGMLWGLCVWVKPHALLLGVAVYVVSIWQRWRSSRWSPLLSDALGLLIGGGSLGAAGLLWLWHTGAWNHFWEVLLIWSKDYNATQKTFWQNPSRFHKWTNESLPFSLVPWMGAGVALYSIFRPRLPTSWNALYAVLFLVWFAQGFLVQVPHEYVVMPILLLGIPLTATWPGMNWVWKCWMVVMFLGLAVSCAAVMDRLKEISCGETWMRCFTEGPSAEMRTKLSANFGEGHTDWVALEKVADYLRSQNVGDGELTCFHAGTHSLFLMLKVKPSIKHIQPNVALNYFPNHLEEIRQELSESRHRFVVSDLQWAYLDWDVVHDSQTTETKLPESFHEAWKHLFPWYEPVVFRAGPYLVHRITGPTRPLW